MKMLAFSDLHTEFCGLAPLRAVREHAHAEIDLIICAGDLTTDPRHGQALLEEHFPDHTCVYVPGNHEFYGNFISDFDSRQPFNLMRSGVAFMDCDEMIIAGQARVLGCALWTDYELFGDRDRAMAIAEYSMSDHIKILERREDGSPQPFKPADALLRHQKSVDWLRSKLSESIKIPTVVVTHHCPHPKSVPPEFEFDEVTPAFCSDLSALIQEFQPAVWIHGHTHSCFDYHVGNTRIVCNPHGYPYENPDFEPALVIEI